MADLYQSGTVATLHRLKAGNVEQLEKDLTEFARTSPITLVLPALYSEFQGESLCRIRDELREIPYLSEIVVAVARAQAEEFAAAKEYFSDMPQQVTLIWNDGPRIGFLYKMLEDNNLHVGGDGKGRSCWLAFGYVQAKAQSRVIALHDCDIATYNRELLARLCYPVADPFGDFAFCKGYYARARDRLYGRVTRLYVTPLIRSMCCTWGRLPILDFLDSFRYPLAGEFALRTDLASMIRIPGDWGLEVGILAEVHRNLSLRRICQSELCDLYDHKHQDLSPDDPQKGLLKMTVDIGKSLLRTLASQGVILAEGGLKSLLAQYVRSAEDMIARYQADARINGLEYDLHAEEQAVDTFAQGLKLASESYLSDPLGIPLIPNWNRVASGVPAFPGRLLDAVRLDAEGAA
jgi:glucosyl-3-phosphoglycerate synthase